MVCTLTGGALHLILFFSSLLIFQFTKKYIYIPINSKVLFGKYV